MTRWSQAARMLAARFALIGGVVFAAAAMLVLSDAAFSLFSQFPRASIRAAAVSLALAGMAAGGLALAYYLLRELSSQSRKRGLSLPPWLAETVAVLRQLHPLLGIAAFSLLLLHVYLMLSGWRGGLLHPRLLSGAAAFLLLTALALTGLRLRRLPGWRRGRAVHRWLAAAFITCFFIHV